MDATRTPRLVSVGYEGRDADELISFLEVSKVDVLVDVRLTPISRKPGLSKTRLAERCRARGIRYLHYRALGNPKDNRDGFRDGDALALERFREILRSDMAEDALGEVGELLGQEVVALLCFEHEHAACHRGLVAEALAEKVPALAIDAI